MHGNEADFLTITFFMLSAVGWELFLTLAAPPRFVGEQQSLSYLLTKMRKSAREIKNGCLFYLAAIVSPW